MTDAPKPDDGFNVYFDPNYRPDQLYPNIEPLLFVFDKVFIYAPNQIAIKRAGLQPQRIVDLVRTGYVVPVASDPYVDEAARNERAKRYEDTDPPVAEFYKYRKEFDGELRPYYRIEKAKGNNKSFAAVLRFIVCHKRHPEKLHKPDYKYTNFLKSFRRPKRFGRAVK